MKRWFIKIHCAISNRIARIIYVIHLQGSQNNRNGLGAFIEVYYQGKQQVYEKTPVRGYFSSVQPMRILDWEAIRR